MANTDQPRGTAFQYPNQWSNGICDCCSGKKNFRHILEINILVVIK